MENRNTILSVKAKAFDMIIDYLKADRRMRGSSISIEKEFEYIVGVIQATDMAIQTIDPPGISLNF